MDDGEITVYVLGNFGVAEYWVGGYPLWSRVGVGSISPDTVVQRDIMNLSQPPLTTKKLRWRIGDDNGQYMMLEYDYPEMPEGLSQYFVGLDPPPGGRVEIQVDANVGPVEPGGPDSQYWRLMATAGDFLGIWWADTREWHENPIPAPPTPTRQYTDATLRSTGATWWTITAVYPLAERACPPIERPPWPYSSSTIRAAQLSVARRDLQRRISGASQGSARFSGEQAAINEARARLNNLLREQGRDQQQST